MSLNFDKEVMRKLWDNYYVPYIKGYFSASGRFRSDDIKTGNIIGYVGSTSSATFFPTQVSLTDSESYDIALKVLPCPKFADGENYVVQQGAGLVVTKTEDDATVKACVEFLKWFTTPEHNILSVQAPAIFRSQKRPTIWIRSVKVLPPLVLLWTAFLPLPLTP